MGEEEKKPEEEGKKGEEGKKEEKEEPKKAEAVGSGEGEKKDGEAKAEAPPPPPPPEEVVMRVYMHCEGCARKVKRCLKGFEGVEEVKTDCRTHKVVVKGRKAAEDPLKVVERVQKKSGRKVELLSPLPPPKPEKEEVKKEEEKPKAEEKKEEPPVIAVVLMVHMHCEACALEIQRKILKMKGVQSAEPDLKGSQVTVKGVFEAAKLVEYVYKRTGRHAVVVKQEPAVKPAEADKGKEEAKDEKKTEADAGAGDKDKGEGEKAKEEKKEGGAADEAADGGGGKVEVEVRKSEFNHYYYYPRSAGEYHVYAPQIFSDENPNACVVM